MDVADMDIDRTADITGVEGGDCVVFPVIPALFFAGGVLNGVYSVGKAVDSFTYWNDYYKNTGYRPRYAFRAGQYDWLGSGGHAYNSFAAAAYSYGKFYR